jgi:hypothetical protein
MLKIDVGSAYVKGCFVDDIIYSLWTVFVVYAYITGLRKAC